MLVKHARLSQPQDGLVVLVEDSARPGGIDVQRSFLDKGVLEMSSISPTDGDALLFGTSPSTDKALREKFSNSWKKIVPWDDFAVQYWPARQF